MKKKTIHGQVQPVVMLGWALLIDGKSIVRAADSLTPDAGGIYIYPSEEAACRNMTVRADPKRFKPIKVRVILST